MNKSLKSKSQLSIWHSFFKWMGVCFVTIIVAILALVIFFTTKFSPIINIDGDRLELFGGTISITGKSLDTEDKTTNQHNHKEGNLEKFI